MDKVWLIRNGTVVLSKPGDVSSMQLELDLILDISSKIFLFLKKCDIM